MEAVAIVLERTLENQRNHQKHLAGKARKDAIV